MQDRIVDHDAEQVIGVDAECKTRQRRSVQEKRQMVEATLVPGASIARVARAYGVNANQLFHSSPVNPLEQHRAGDDLELLRATGRQIGLRQLVDGIAGLSCGADAC